MPRTSTRLLACWLAGLLACWCNFITSAPLLVQIVALLLRQIQALVQVLGAVVAAAIGIFDGVAKLTSIASGSRSSQYTGMVRVLPPKTVQALLGSKEQAVQPTAHRAIRQRGASVVMLPGKITAMDS